MTEDEVRAMLKMAAKIGLEGGRRTGPTASMEYDEKPVSDAEWCDFAAREVAWIFEQRGNPDEIDPPWVSCGLAGRP
jgi:hypothetical protein